MSLEKKVIDPPSIGDYLHGYTLSYKSYGSLWQLLGTGAWFWTRENISSSPEPTHPHNHPTPGKLKYPSDILLPGKTVGIA
uniref:Uncharacterized protein n=1 Tax=Magallana gigas TaxID=29159 RepID=K1R0Z5_MAGGI